MDFIEYIGVFFKNIILLYLFVYKMYMSEIKNLKRCYFCNIEMNDCEFLLLSLFFRFFE